MSRSITKLLSSLIIALALYHVSIASVANQTPRMGLSPPRFEFTWDGSPINDSLTVLNMSAEPLPIEVSVRTWDLDEGNKTRLLEPSNDSLDRSFVINPRSFTIPPGSQQSLRFSIRPKHGLSRGEHRAMIFVKEMPRDNTYKDSGVGVRFNYGIPVYVHSGTVTKTGVLNSILVGPNTGAGTPVLFDFSSSGSSYARLKGDALVWPQDLFPGKQNAIDLLGKIRTEPESTASASFSYTRLPGTPVLPDSRRTIEAPLIGIKPEISYTILVSGSLGDVTFERFLTLNASDD